MPWASAWTHRLPPPKGLSQCPLASHPSAPPGPKRQEGAEPLGGALGRAPRSHFSPDGTHSLPVPPAPAAEPLPRGPASPQQPMPRGRGPHPACRPLPSRVDPSLPPSRQRPSRCPRRVLTPQATGSHFPITAAGSPLVPSPLCPEHPPSTTRGNSPTCAAGWLGGKGAESFLAPPLCDPAAGHLCLPAQRQQVTGYRPLPGKAGDARGPPARHTWVLGAGRCRQMRSQGHQWAPWGS